ncbi:MAG: hypothetical protein OXH11_07435 [Candidatus Aminicenantes bacterium]|nr:hypothetical protein [Candidatus Aminicenantes bacterium]
MSRSGWVWTALMVVAGIYLLVRLATGGMGMVYVQDQPVEVQEPGQESWSRAVGVDPKRQGEEGVRVSWSRTAGNWLAALFTLCILSFLYGDNPLYKLAEAVFVGVSAAYWMVVGFWTGIVQNLFSKLAPDLIRSSLLPGLPESQEQELIYLFPLLLSVLMLMRLSPVGGWISRWALAFFIGATAGIRLLGYLQSDFIRQIQSTILPLVVVGSQGFDFSASIQNLTIVVGVLSCLTYFFFSIEHKGMVGGVSRLGIWFLMITFGAGFGYTVMGRIALMAQRLEFLADDWLWIIDPASRRLGM